ncbi:MAG: MotA/TolQ/ExbB proton channel family protein, partial [Pirellulales bacterium]|nr:MotA/TolQ/ExbB proton channel family protein [Pirellulales bacterium]
RARIRPLNTVGSIAPLVGLLGTVVGMIIAFHTASQSGLGKAELLAKGIYMALLTTAGGLSVAIPSLLLGSFFSGRVERYFRDMDKLLIPLVPHLVKRPQPVQEQPQPPNSTPTSTNPLMSNAIRAS